MLHGRIYITSLEPSEAPRVPLPQQKQHQHKKAQKGNKASNAKSKNNVSKSSAASNSMQLPRDAPIEHPRSSHTKSFWSKIPSIAILKRSVNAVVPEIVDTVEMDDANGVSPGLSAGMELEGRLPESGPHGNRSNHLTPPPPEHLLKGAPGIPPPPSEHLLRDSKHEQMDPQHESHIIEQKPVDHQQQDLSTENASDSAAMDDDSNHLSADDWEVIDEVPQVDEEAAQDEIVVSNLNQLPGFQFPETEHLDKQGKASIGIAFSGGGARSASCTLGQLRALHALDLIERTRYFSSVSGSSWTLVPFLYGDVPRDFFVGIPPEDWNLDWKHIFSGTMHITEYMKHRRRKWVNLFVEEVQKMENGSVQHTDISMHCETRVESNDEMQGTHSVEEESSTVTITQSVPAADQTQQLTDASSSSMEDEDDNSSQRVASLDTPVQHEINSMLKSEEMIGDKIMALQVQEELDQAKPNEVMRIELVNDDTQVQIHTDEARTPRSQTQYVEIRTRMHRQYFLHHTLPDPTQYIPFQLQNLSIFAQFVYQLWNKASHYSYAKVLHNVFVKSFNAGDSTHYFSWRKSDVQDIVQRNTGVLTESDFVTYNNETDPFLIINGCMLNLKQAAPTERKSYFEFTPLYVGASKLYEQGKMRDGKPSPTVGGIYCEPYLFNSLSCLQMSKDDTEVHVPLQNQNHRLSLCDIVACTSSAPSEEAASRGAMLASMFPRFHYWTTWSESNENALPSDQTSDLLPNGETETEAAVEDLEDAMKDEDIQEVDAGNQNNEDNLTDATCTKSDKKVIEAKLYNFGDGGLLENTGMMALLKRQQRFMIVFLNTKAPLHISNTILTTDVSEDCSIPFGPLHYDAHLQERALAQVAKRKFFNYYPRKLKRFRRRVDYEMNHVFKDEDGSKYRHLVETLYKKRMSGEAAICEDEYDVLDNDFYGIKGGWKCRVLWVYNDVCKRFEESCLSPQLRSKLNLRQQGSAFYRFPHFRTVGENAKSFGGLHTEQVNLLSLQHTYNIMYHKDLFLDFYRRAEEVSKRERAMSS